MKKNSRAEKAVGKKKDSNFLFETNTLLSQKEWKENLADMEHAYYERSAFMKRSSIIIHFWLNNKGKEVKVRRILKKKSCMARKKSHKY